MAFLHRVVNGEGTLEREYAIGSGRMDLCLRYGALTLAMELKVWRDGRPDPLPEGLTQLDDYLAGLGLDRGWLIIFDRRGEQPPIAERTSSSETDSPRGRRIQVAAPCAFEFDAAGLSASAQAPARDSSRRPS
jgi:hypothetical protein